MGLPMAGGEGCEAVREGPPLKAVAALALSAALLVAAVAGARILASRMQPRAADLPARERPSHEYSSEFSLAALERANTFPVGQYRFIGSSFLVHVAEVEKSAVPRRGALARGADNHELLRVRLTLEHPGGCAGFGASTGKGVSLALAYRNGYDSERGGLSVVQGTCSVDPARSLAPGWRSSGVCEFHYDKAWGPLYLVLSSIEDGVVRPQAKIPID